MVKLMLVDDNKMFRLAFKTMINWELTDYEIYLEAMNGLHAIELLQNEDVDIVITDISMPEMNGLELIKELKNKKPNIQVIVVSNYDDFDFVKDAFKIGAKDYLLKHEMTSSNVLEVLDKCVRDIEKPEKNENYEKSYFEIDHFADRLVHGQIEIKEIKENLQKITNIAKYNNLAFVMIHFIRENDRIYSFREWLIKETNQENILLIAQLKGNRYLILFQFSELKSKGSMIQKLNSILQNLYRKSKKNGYSISIVSSNITDSENHLLDICEQCLNASDWLLYEEKKHIIFYSKNMKPLKNLVDPIKVMGSVIYQESLIKDKEKVLFEIENIFNKIKADKVNFISLNRIIEELISFILKLFRLYNICVIDIIGSEVNLYQYIQSVFYLEDKKNKIINIIDTIYKKSMTYMDVNNREIRIIMKYIDENYTKSLTLANIAKKFNYSSNYLSTHFKKETGKNIIEYIKYIRIQHAKELLKDNNMKTYEIALNLGFKSTSYFCTVFKEVTRLSPKEYRDNIIQ